MHPLFSRAARLALAPVCLLLAAGWTDAPAAPSEPAPPILGVVRDTAGDPLPSVRIVIAELGRATTTAADGTFAFRSLRPGTYHLDATLIGYAPQHAVVNVPEEGPPVRVELRMAVTPLTLSGLQVTASPTGEDPLRIAQSTVQLGGKELGRNLGGSVAETLDEQPGISTRYAGPATSTPVIRGLSGERVLVLQDGNRTGDLSSTSADHGLSVDPLAATQIEVVRGPASLLYGNNALGGVVNVIVNDIPTSVPSHREGYIAGQLESVTPGGALSGSLSLPLGPSWALTMRGGGRNMDDVRLGGAGELGNTDFRNLSGAAGLGYIREGVSAGLAAQLYGFEYGLPSAPGEGEAGVRIEGSRRELNGRADWTLGTAGIAYLRLAGGAQWYTHDEVEPSGEIGTTFKLNTQTLRLSGRTRFGPLSGAVGASALFKQYAPEGEEALTPTANSDNIGAFLFQEIALGGPAAAERPRTPRLQFGLRYDLYRIASEAEEDFGPAASRDFQNVSGSIGLNVPLSGGVAVSANAARAFRAPTVEELFSNAFHAALGSFDVGNPALEAEVNNGAEAVLRAQTERLTGQFSAFYNRIDNYIAPNVAGDTIVVEEDGDSFVAPLVVFGQADAALRGVEGQLEAAVGRDLVLGLVGDIVRGEFVDGPPLPFMPAAHLGGSVRWDDTRYSAGIEARHAFAQTDVPEGELATGGYTLVDLSAGLTLVRGGLVHSVTLRADNVFDVLYREATSRVKAFAPNPGRNVTVVYRVLF